MSDSPTAANRQGRPKPTSSVGMIIREREPVNFEFPFDQLQSFLTPNDLFYIRSHFKAPMLDKDSYELRIDGALRAPLVLGYEELRKLPSETRAATLECAGNSRVFLVPQVGGAQWELGAVGNAEWTGVPLRLLLEEAGLAEDAVEIVFEGADRGKAKERPAPPQPISYARSLLRSKALAPEVLGCLPDEWAGPAAGSWLSGTADCAGALWDGFGEVAHSNLRGSGGVSRLLADFRLWLLG